VKLEVAPWAIAIVAGFSFLGPFGCPYSTKKFTLTVADTAITKEYAAGVPKIFEVTGTAAIARERGDAAATPKTEAFKKFRRLKKAKGLLIFLHTPHFVLLQLDR